jgi:hypothetical protein
MRLASNQLTELASGVDAFYLSGVAALPQLLVADLTAAQDEAREARTGISFPLGEFVFRVQSGGLQRYAFRLEHPHGVIGLTTSKALPAVRVQPRAAFIHAIGVQEALSWFTELLEAALGHVVWKASRLDLFMDSHGWDLEAQDRSRFLCRAGQRVTYEAEDALTGLRFGSGKSGAVLARIYDKTEEMRLKGTDWWPAKWGEQYRPGERVLRVEFQIGRPLMREVGVSTPAEVLDQLPGIWGYLTDEWLTYRDVTDDATRSRWPVAGEWQDVRNAALRDDALGLERVYAGEVAGSIRRILPGLRGYLTSAGALLGSKSLEDTMSRVGRLLADDEEHSGIAFAGRLRDKRLSLGLA